MVGRSPKNKSIFSFLPLIFCFLTLISLCVAQPPDNMCISGGLFGSVATVSNTRYFQTSDNCRSVSCSGNGAMLYMFNFMKQQSFGCPQKVNAYIDQNSMLWNSTSYFKAKLSLNIYTVPPTGAIDTECVQPALNAAYLPSIVIRRSSWGLPGTASGGSNMTLILNDNLDELQTLNITRQLTRNYDIEMHNGCISGGVYSSLAVACDLFLQINIPNWMRFCGVNVRTNLYINDYMTDTIPEAYVSRLPQFVWNDGHNDQYPLAPQETQYNFTDPFPESNLTRLGAALTGCTDSGSTNYKSTGFPVLSLYGKGGSMYLSGYGSVIRTDAIRLDAYNNHGIDGSMNKSINYPFLGHVEVQCQLSSGFMQFRPRFCIADNTLGASGLGCYSNLLLDLPYINVYSENNGYQLSSDFSIYLQPSQLGDTQGIYFTMGGTPNSISSGYGCCWSITLTADIPPIAGTTTVGSSVSVTNFPSLQQVKLQSDDITNLQHVVITSVLAPESMNVNVKNKSLTTHYDSTGFDESGATHQKIITSGWEVPSPPSVKIDDSSSIPVTFPSNAAITIAGVSTSAPLHTVVDNTVPVQVTNVVTVTDNIGTNYSVAGYSIHLEPDGPATAYIEPYSQLPLGGTATSLYSFMQSSKENKQYFIFGISVLITMAFINILTVYLVMIYVNKNFKRRWVNNHQF